MRSAANADAYALLVSDSRYYIYVYDVGVGPNCWTNNGRLNRKPAYSGRYADLCVLKRNSAKKSLRMTGGGAAGKSPTRESKRVGGRPAGGSGGLDAREVSRIFLPVEQHGGAFLLQLLDERAHAPRGIVRRDDGLERDRLDRPAGGGEEYVERSPAPPEKISTRAARSRPALFRRAMLQWRGPPARRRCARPLCPAPGRQCRSRQRSKICARLLSFFVWKSTVGIGFTSKVDVDGVIAVDQNGGQAVCTAALEIGVVGRDQVFRGQVRVGHALFDNAFIAQNVVKPAADVIPLITRQKYRCFRGIPA